MRIAPSALVLLGFIAAACFAFASAFRYQFGMLSTPLACSLFAVAPFVIVRRDPGD